MVGPSAWVNVYAKQKELGSGEHLQYEPLMRLQHHLFNCLGGLIAYLSSCLTV